MKQIWELHRDMEIGHLHAAVELYKKHMGSDPAEFIPMTLPEPTTFQSNVQYVREVLEKTVRLTAKEKEYVDVNRLPKDDRYFQWRKEVNGEWIPSVGAVKEHIEEEGRDYRYETAPHPIDAYRERQDPKLPYKFEI